ncbi:MAG: hypothetical protein CSA33_05905 [Desulfobulbus propionicus]|nr:MAG: hypothetical protein CSA33_05905 [Desulfobulbus propionicus]
MNILSHLRKNIQKHMDVISGDRLPFGQTDHQCSGTIFGSLLSTYISNYIALPKSTEPVTA